MPFALSPCYIICSPPRPRPIFLCPAVQPTPPRKITTPTNPSPPRSPPWSSLCLDLLCTRTRQKQPHHSGKPLCRSPRQIEKRQKRTRTLPKKAPQRRLEPLTASTQQQQQQRQQQQASALRTLPSTTNQRQRQRQRQRQHASTQASTHRASASPPYSRTRSSPDCTRTSSCSLRS